MRFRRVTVGLAGLLVCVGAAVYFAWPRPHLEVELQEARRSPNGRWIAVVQLENYSIAEVVNDPVYAVRLRKAARRGSQGDLAMNVPVNYPAPPPAVNWDGGTLIVMLVKGQKYQYFVTPVDGVPILVRWGANSAPDGKAQR